MGKGTGRGGICFADTKLVNCFLFVANILFILAGVVVLAVGALDQRGNAFSAYSQYKQTNPLVGSVARNAWLYIVAGAVLIGIGALGVLAHCAAKCCLGKLFYFLYNLVLLLAFLFLGALCVIAWYAYGTTGPNGSNNISSNSWLMTVQSNPRFVCSQELHYGCAGYNANQCSTSNPDVQYCPGISTGGSCRTSEELNAGRGCAEPINEAFRHDWFVLAVTCTVALAVIVLCYLASCWRTFCTCCGI
ncbi:hypothetical protein CYME_CMS426C [Cyanidioschyzon merolae strain 10D]|jgi:hypothetical protein|uniref:Tetraspanin n=1 Tax=Cyanidioschyzon merolae (strain NIES-3377 / 10D) TaxID=280699 RepID=M1V7D4_CYAM1|nr:hypothetical protein CYME_CMS426C [Cyanidioschyzon merolae strain 10D]BAM82985.1 hypothetical protein CYME_CMS426C [Cyanidioschyzon merolae strain 10D]|eukprot:XP_005539021.1 hypothetical protein CYME_CMS426C [Cyanidioschyzon merolae strain 10D]